MMRCDVTKFNKRFGICKVRCVCTRGLPVLGWLLDLAATAVPAEGCCAVLGFCLATSGPLRHLTRWPDLSLPSPQLSPISPSSLPPLPPPHPLSQMAAKAYVGEDLVCEADLTLVMAPEGK